MLPESIYFAVTLFIVIIILVSIICLIYLAYIAYVHWLYSHLPGPKFDNFVLGNLPQLIQAQKTGLYRHQLFLKWAKEHGSLYRIFVLHKCLVIPTGAAMIKALLTRSDDYPKADAVYRPLYYACGLRFLGNGLVTNTNHREWKVRRHVLNPAFSRRMLVTALDDINQIADDWIMSLMKLANGTTTVCMAEKICRVTMEIIGKIAFHMEVGALLDDNNRFFLAMDRILEGIHEQLVDPLIKVKWSRREFVRSVQNEVKFMREEIRTLITERMRAMYNNENVPEDALSMMLGGMEKHDNIQMDDLIDDFITIFVAGQDTVASTLSFLLNELGQNPEVCRKLLAEVEDVVGGKRHIGIGDITRLQYMTQTINETMRLYPPAPGTARQNSRPTQLAGFHLPPRSFIVISMFVVHRLENHHPAPDQFKPERFDSDQKIDLYTYLPFSTGQRSCLGKQLAFMEMKVLLCKFLQAFSYTLDAEQSFDVEDHNTLRPKGGTRLTLTPRDPLHR